MLSQLGRPKEGDYGLGKSLGAALLAEHSVLAWHQKLVVRWAVANDGWPAQSQELEGLSGDGPFRLAGRAEMAAEADIGSGNCCRQVLVRYPVHKLHIGQVELIG